jgi:hypothetical protein
MPFVQVKLIKPKKLFAAVAVAAAAVLLPAMSASAGSGGQLRIEPSWYDGHSVSFLQPSLFSANTNGGTFACFGLGPDLSAVTRPTAPLYVILDDTATQDHCDGQPTLLRHDHVLSVAPGDPGYTGAWTLVFLVEAIPGSVNLASTPFTSAAAVQQALTAHTLIDVSATLSSSPVTMVGPVIGGAGR